MRLNDETEPACDRILRAALEIFAERGFKATTVRDICQRAEVNVASVNYYFSSKEALYRDVLVYSFKEADRRYPQVAFADETLPPEDRLQLFIRTLLLRLMDDSQLGFHAQLMAREIADPTGALDYIVDTLMRPRFQQLAQIIPLLAGTSVDEADISRLVHGILGQCLVYRHSRPLIERLSPEIIASADAIDRTADVIYRFSLAGLRHFAQPNPPAA